LPNSSSRSHTNVPPIAKYPSTASLVIEQPTTPKTSESGWRTVEDDAGAVVIGVTVVVSASVVVVVGAVVVVVVEAEVVWVAGIVVKTASSALPVQAVMTRTRYMPARRWIRRHDSFCLVMAIGKSPTL
jgi:hypothetical protein